MFSRVYEIYEKIFTIGLSSRPLSMLFFYPNSSLPLEFEFEFEGEILEYRIVFHMRFDIFSLLCNRNLEISLPFLHSLHLPYFSHK
jgi:hypothetical protein